MKMNENIEKAFLDDPVNGGMALRSSFKNFITYFHWHIFRQQFIFKDFHNLIVQKLEDIAFGRNKKQHLLINIPPRFGKALSNHTLILTRNGWKKHGDLIVGDEVLSPTGQFVKVLAVSQEYDMDRKVVFSDGDEIICHHNHEWVIETNSRQIIKETDWLKNKNLYNGIQGKRGSKAKYKLPTIEYIIGENKKLPVAPYALGAWIGDGTRTVPCITISKQDEVIAQEIQKLGYPISNIYVHHKYGTYRYYFKNLMNSLRSIDLCFNDKTKIKHIPDVYLTSSINQRLELLAGLLDTDGYLDNKGRYHFSTISERLRDDFIALLSTFGWRASVSRVKACTSSSGIVGRHDLYYIGFNPDCIIPCRLKRKQNKQTKKTNRIAFHSIENGYFGKGKCIQVEGGVYLAGKRLKPTHNSLILKYFCAWSFFLNPRSNGIYTSYSDDLVNDFSKEIRNIVISPAFKAMSNVELDKSKTASDYWGTTAGGGFRAAPLGGALTGYGAGVSTDEFGCGILIDDPLKASSVKSNAELQACIDYYTNTLKSRLNNQTKTPIIMIMQRLSVDDLSGYVLENEAEDWDHIKLPALNEETGEALWAEKFPADALLKLKETVPFVYYGQYQQEPIVLGGSVIKSKWFNYHAGASNYRYQLLYFTADTAQKKGEANDFTVICLWGKTFENQLHLIDMVRGKFDALELRQEIIRFWEKWKSGINGTSPYGFYVEDKSSGIGVIQELRKTYPLPLIPITRARHKNSNGLNVNMDKFSRVMTMLPYITNGWVYLPIDEKNDISSQVLAECVAFKADLTHKHDDIIDNICDGVDIAFGATGISSIFI